MIKRSKIRSKRFPGSPVEIGDFTFVFD